MHRSTLRPNNIRTLLILAAAAVPLAVSTEARADRFWKNIWPSGNWSNAFWSQQSPFGSDSVGPPTSGESAYIENFDSFNRVVQLDVTATVQNFYLGNSSGGTNTVSQTTAVNFTSNNYEEIGVSGKGVYAQSAGTNTPGLLELGYNAGDGGTYSLSGTGTLIVNSGGYAFNVGYSGSGTFSQTGGTVNSAIADLSIAAFLGSTGNYVLSTGALSTQGAFIGSSGAGTFTQNGGTHSIGLDGLFVGGNIAGVGTYLLNGGTLSVLGNELIGSFGSGTFNQTSGVHSIGTSLNARSLLVGYQSTSVGNYLLSGTGVLNVTGYESIGITGSGTFTQTGGIHTVGTTTTAQNLYVGDSFIGDFFLSQTGSLTVTGDEIVGRNSIGLFSQTGGAQTIGSSISSHNLTVGSASLVAGIYQLGGTATLMVNGSEDIGLGGIGIFTQSGGTHTIGTAGTPQSLDLGVFNSSNGTFNLNGTGSLNVTGIEYVGDFGAGTFAQSGGTHTIGSASTPGFLAIGNQTSGVGYYSLGSVGTLSTYGSEVIGQNGTGTFNQTGGLHSVSQNLSLGFSGSGTYLLSGGTLNVTGQEYISNGGPGFLNQNAGMNTAAAITVGQFRAGTYLLSGSGSLSDLTEILGVGPFGLGTFNQSGGVHSIGSLTLGSASGSGTYLVSGTGSVIVAGNATLGLSGSGQIAITGGSMSVAGTLKIYSSPNTSVVLNGGQLSAGTIDFSGTPSLLNWTSGTLSLINGLTIDTGNLLGASLTLGAGKTLGTSSILLNNGQINLAGGALVVQSFQNAASFAGYGSISASTMTNNGQFTQSGGSLYLSPGSGGFQNSISGTTMLAPGLQFQLVSGTFQNAGFVALNNGVFTGGGVLNNTVAGVVQGPGVIGSGFINAGLLAVPNGNTAVPSFNNTGVIEMAGTAANLNGAGTIANSGNIQGYGKVSENIANSGRIQATGGDLTLTGTITTFNSPFSQIGASTGNRVLMAGAGNFPSNAGVISLTGGTVDTNFYGLTNTGTISGRGSLYTGGLSNSGTMSFSGGFADVYGPVTNTGKITVTGGSTTTFYNDVNTSVGPTGSITINTNSTAVFLGNFNGQSRISGPGTKDFEGASGAGPLFTVVGSTVVGASAVVTADFVHENNVTVYGTLTIPNNGTPAATSQIANLIISDGTLDLSDNGVVVTNTSELSSIHASIRSAYDGGKWDQPGLTSSRAAADPGAHAIGYGLASTLGLTSYNGITFSDAVIARYTLIGDTSLVGRVGLGDYTKVIQNLGKTGASWSDGNFDYSGNVNLGDYTAVIRNLGRSDGQSSVFNATGPSAQQVKASALTLHSTPAVAQASTATDVTLLVNPSNGRVTLVNALQTGQAVITAYTINSPSQSLLPFSADAGGKYLANALENNPSIFYKASNGLTYNLWTGIKNVSTFIGEGFSNHYNANVDSTWTNYTLATNGYALGTLFKRLSSGGTKDLVFQWEDANLNTYTSVVTYVGAVPEPGSVSLIAVGAMALLRRRRRRHLRT